MESWSDTIREYPEQTMKNIWNILNSPLLTCTSSQTNRYLLSSPTRGIQFKNGNSIRIEWAPCGGGAKMKLAVLACRTFCAVSSFRRGLVWCYIFFFIPSLIRFVFIVVVVVVVDAFFFVVMLMVIFLLFSISVMPMLCTELYNEDFSLRFLFAPLIQFWVNL